MNRANHDLADRSGYEIRIDGHLDDRWSAWFEGLTFLQADDGTTVIRCSPMDQAALHGLLRGVRDVGLPLVSVARIASDEASAPRLRASTDTHEQEI